LYSLLLFFLLFHFMHAKPKMQLNIENTKLKLKLGEKNLK